MIAATFWTGAFAAAAVAVLVLGARHFGRLQAELVRMASAQEDLRREMQRGREASLLQIADAAQTLRGDIGQAHRALTEVRAAEAGRARQMEQAAESLRRLEAVIAGSASRGAAGENILARAFAQLPPDLLAVNLPCGSKVVEYALRLPGGRLLPIDSKWTSAAALERLDGTSDPVERRRLAEQVGREVRLRAREVSKYLDPERTLGLGVLAIPDAAYAWASDTTIDAYRDGVLVVPYSLALQYVLALYRLTARFGAAFDGDRLSLGLQSLAEDLRRMDDELEGRLSRGIVQLANARDALRARLGEAQRTAAGLAQEAEGDVGRARPALAGSD